MLTGEHTDNYVAWLNEVEPNPELVADVAEMIQDRPYWSDISCEIALDTLHSIHGYPAVQAELKRQLYA